MMSQTFLPFNYQKDNRDSKLTAFAGLPAWLELAHVTELFRNISRWLKIRTDKQGFSDALILSALILLQLAGGDSVDDLERLRGDEGFVRVANRVALTGLKRRQRRKLERSWKNGNNALAIPSPSVVRRWLNEFHNLEAEVTRPAKGAFIPAPNKHLRLMKFINAGLLTFLQKHDPSRVATLDMDATLIETCNKNALFCYKKFRAYQPLNVWWAEQQMMVHTEFRDGNVPAGFEQMRLLDESLSLLPDSVEEVRLRSDSAGYQWDLMKYCQKRTKAAGTPRILFAIASDVTQSFREAVSKIAKENWHAVWHVRNKGTSYAEAVKSDQQWAEVDFVPNELAQQPQSHEYRFIAIREPMQNELPGSVEPQLPFQTYKSNGGRYKLFGIVTNIPHAANEAKAGENRGCFGEFCGDGMCGESIIHWHRERCGRSEQAHAILKSDLGGGKMPSSKFGVNSAWWWISVITMNLNRIMGHLVLGKNFENIRMKGLRLNLINIPARIIEHGRQLFIRVAEGCAKAFDVLQAARARMMELASLSG